jgi:hypothetical protein
MAAGSKRAVYAETVEQRDEKLEAASVSREMRETVVIEERVEVYVWRQSRPTKWAVDTSASRSIHMRKC